MGGNSFTKLDFSHAYQQIELDVESQQYSTNNPHHGLLHYTRLPFGILSALSIFQRPMENLLQGISKVCVYIDDTLITGSTRAEHLQKISQVLEQLQNAGIILKKYKCAFMLPPVEYLGHTISAQGLHASKSKVSGVVGAPKPRM